MPPDQPHPEAGKIAGYSHLHRLAHDGTITDAELTFIQKLALRDIEIDKHELEVLDAITGRLQRQRVSPHAWEEIKRFRQKYDLPPLPEE